MPFKDLDDKREYQLRWIQKRRTEFFKDKSCVKCGSTVGLELDHIDPKTKVIDPARIWSLSPINPKRIAELDKCQVLCNPCHKEKSSVDRATNPEHGTREKYARDKCRCPRCRVANSQYIRQWRSAQ